MKRTVYLDSTIPSYLFDERENIKTFYKMDFLMTWNCNHLANANKRPHIRVINTRLGLYTPEIVTPLELFTERSDDY